MTHPTPAPCQERSALADWDAHCRDGEAAARLHGEILGGLAGFTDSFMDAIAGDFLAEADEHGLRQRHRHQPAMLVLHLAANRRALLAQRALHVLYNKLLAGAALSLEERSLAEHARDLAEGYAGREASRRCRA
jgi:hypothetical protein